MSHATVLPSDEIGNFHNRDGWFFKRLPDGSVRIQKTDTTVFDSPAVIEHIIPANEWASIVAHVSAKGETANSYATAIAFHAGELRRATDLNVLHNAANAEDKRAAEAESRGDVGEASVRRINAADLREIATRVV